MEITVQKREKNGKSSTKKVRNTGNIPGVVYGLDQEPVSVSVAKQDLSTILKEARGSKTVFTIHVDDGKNQSSERVLMYQVDRDAISRNVTHAEFLRADESKKIKVELAVRLVGRSPGVKLGGVLIQKTSVAKIQAIPSQIPDHIELDISNLNIGDSVRIRDFDTKGQFDFLNSGDDAIVTIAAPRSMSEEAVAATAEAGAAPAAGDKKAADAKKAPEKKADKK